MAPVNRDAPRWFLWTVMALLMIAVWVVRAADWLTSRRRSS